MRQCGYSGCTNPQIFGISPFTPADFEASSTMCTCCFETQSSPGCTFTRRSKFLTHSLLPKSQQNSRKVSRNLSKVLFTMRLEVFHFLTLTFVTQNSYSHLKFLSFHLHLKERPTYVQLRLLHFGFRIRFDQILIFHFPMVHDFLTRSKVLSINNHNSHYFVFCMGNDRQ